MKNILLASITCFILTLAEFGQETHYDRFKDFTLVRSNEMALTATGEYAVVYPAVSATIGCGFKGQTPNKAAFFISFNATSSDWLFLGRPNELNFLIDGKSLAIGKGERTGDIDSSGRRVRVHEQVYYSDVRLSDLAAIVAAKKTEFQINGFESGFTNDDRSEINKLLAACTPK